MPRYLVERTFPDGLVIPVAADRDQLLGGAQDDQGDGHQPQQRKRQNHECRGIGSGVGQVLSKHTDAVTAPLRANSPSLSQTQ